MSAEKNHILFVSHLATRSGAPILLLEIIKAVSEQKNIPFYILCMEEGELANDFRKLGTTFIWKKKPWVSKNRLIKVFFSVFNKASQVINAIYILSKVRKSRLVFYNTIVNGHLQKKLSVLGSKSICYVHELEAAIHMLTNEETRKTVFENTELFLSVSEAVKTNLIKNHHVSSKNIKVVSSPLNKTYRDKDHYCTFISSFRERFQIGNAAVIGVVATNEWRKGFDLFIPLVILYFTLFPEANTYFVWKGVKADGFNSFFDLYDYEKCQHKNRILLLPHDADSIEQIACLDIHLLLSREDPYPLVVLEAATFGIPTVCFANSGGTPEFVEDDCGFVVPYADLNLMAVRLNTLIEDIELRANMGFNCRQKVKIRHDKKKSLQVINEIIVNNMAK